MALKREKGMPDKIFAQVIPKSRGGLSIFKEEIKDFKNQKTHFKPIKKTMKRAIALLGKKGAGFTIIQTTDYSINICGDQKTYENAFNITLEIVQKKVLKGGGKKEAAEFIINTKTGEGLIEVEGADFEDCISGIAIEEPRYFMSVSAFAPAKSYWHLRVPNDVALALNANKVHRQGITGKGVKIAMVDSGHYKHPWFEEHGYRIEPVKLGPGATDPGKDEHGHGTGESANIFSIAPDVTLYPVKMAKANAASAFIQAIFLKPDIITCSWGSNQKSRLSASNKILRDAITYAWNEGIVVIFSSGNGHWGFPGQHPDVISVGGVFMHRNGSLEASNYASGFNSKIYRNPQRIVPDVCGLTGMNSPNGKPPGAMYIMLPVEPSCELDKELFNDVNAVHYQTQYDDNTSWGDETANDDGWAVFSGTSAAAPQIAGLVALMKQARPNLKPDEIRTILMDTARDVITGHSNTATDGGSPAMAGPDSATGHGLVNAFDAITKIKELYG